MVFSIILILSEVTGVAKHILGLELKEDWNYKANYVRVIM